MANQDSEIGKGEGLFVESVVLVNSGNLIAINSEVVIGCERDSCARLKLAVFARERIPVYLKGEGRPPRVSKDPERIGSRRFRLPETPGRNIVHADPYSFELKRKDLGALYIDICSEVPVKTEQLPYQDGRIALWHLRDSPGIQQQTP